MCVRFAFGADLEATFWWEPGVGDDDDDDDDDVRMRFFLCAVRLIFTTVNFVSLAFFI